MAILTPAPDEFGDMLRLALELSDRPRDVRLTTVQAIEVPDEVAERLERFLALDDEDLEPSDVIQEPVKRRPGRPRKNPVPEEQE